MSARQLIVLVIAAIAAIGALFIIRGMGSPRAEPTADARAIDGEQVLVAAHDIAAGAALTPGDIAVRQFPVDAIGPTMIRGASQADTVGAVTRRAFAQGEPITQGSVVQPDGRGFMAAQLQPGYRAVAMEVEARTAAGGFIQPNDHVDIILTYRGHGSGDDAEAVHSEVVLQDIRVLALDDRVGAQTTGAAPEKADASVALLELSANDARVLAGAEARGDLALALRPVEAEAVGLRTPSQQQAGVNEGGNQVRVHAFGVVHDGDGQ